MLGDVLGHRTEIDTLAASRATLAPCSLVSSLRQQAGRGQWESGASVSFHVAHRPGGQQEC